MQMLIRYETTIDIVVPMVYTDTQDRASSAISAKFGVLTAEMQQERQNARNNRASCGTEKATKPL